MTILTSFKHFAGRAGLIQTRALTNWRTCWPNVEIVDFQHEVGTSFEGIRRVVLEGNNDEPPRFDRIAKWAAKECVGDVCLYLNGDILFGAGFNMVLDSLPAEEFLGIGQRIDLLPDGREQLHRPSGMDYFFFRAGMFGGMPPTVVGRAYYDSAIVAWCLRKGVKVIDLTAALSALHQWHDYSHVKQGRAEVFGGEAALANKTNNNLVDFGPHIADAPLAMTPEGAIVANPKKSWLRSQGYWKLWNIITRGGKNW